MQQDILMGPELPLKGRRSLERGLAVDQVYTAGDPCLLYTSNPRL